MPTNALHELPAPTKELVRDARQAAELTQSEAGQLIARTGQDWYRYEKGTRTMDAPTWALFLLSVGQHPTLRIGPARR